MVDQVSLNFFPCAGCRLSRSLTHIQAHTMEMDWLTVNCSSAFGLSVVSGNILFHFLRHAGKARKDIEADLLDSCLSVAVHD